MKFSNQYIDELSQKMDSAASENDLDALIGIQDEWNDLTSTMRRLRNMFGTDSLRVSENDSEFDGAFESDIEAIECRSAQFSAICAAYISEVEKEIEDIEKHGSMEDQARADYNDARL